VDTSLRVGARKPKGEEGTQVLVALNGHNGEQRQKWKETEERKEELEEETNSTGQNILPSTSNSPENTGS